MSKNPIRISDFSLVPTRATAVSVGQKFGRLTVAALGQVQGTYRYYAVCECECGSALKRVRLDGLTAGSVLSCGCLQRESIKTHGCSKSPHMRRWQHMIARCEDPKNPAYPDYGGRGISVCPAWHDIKAFITDLPPGYFEGAEIDRIDNDGNYEPGNVRWATRSQNADNRRSGRQITCNGKTQSLRRWAEEVGLGDQTLWSRIVELGWPIEKALTTPSIAVEERMAKAREARWGRHTKSPSKPKRTLRTVQFNGQEVTIASLSDRTGVPVKLLRKRIFERGWPVEKAVQ